MTIPARFAGLAGGPSQFLRRVAQAAPGLLGEERSVLMQSVMNGEIGSIADGYFDDRRWVVRYIARALALLALLACSAAQAEEIRGAAYDAVQDAIVLDIAYRGTSPRHRFKVQWGQCSEGDPDQVAGRVIDLQGRDAAERDYRVRARLTLVPERSCESACSSAPTESTNTRAWPARSRAMRVGPRL